MQLRQSIMPPVVKNLIILNVIMYIAFNILFPKYSDMLALHYWGASDFKPMQLVTYMFMHAGFWHIALNMLALWMFGSQVENIWGPKRFLFFYLACGLGSAIFYYTIFAFQVPGIKADLLMNGVHGKYEYIWQNFQFFDQIPRGPLSYNDATQVADIYMNSNSLVGASGAIFGVLLAYGMMFPNSLIYIYFFIPLKAKYLVIIYGLIELYSGIQSMRGGGDNVAHFAHVGGMAIGFIILMFWRARGELYQ